METQTRHHLTLTLVALPLLAALAWLSFAGTGDHGDDAASTDRTAAVAPARPEPGDAAGPDSGVEPNPERTPIAIARDATVRDVVRVLGRVLDAYGEPLGGALVGDVDSRRPATSAADGRFELAVECDRAARSITFLALAPDHAPFASVRDVESGNRSLDVGDIELLRGGRIRGQIQDHAGDGLPGATVTLQPRRSSSWPRSLDLTAFLQPASTTAEGFYAFADLVPGGYRITASAPGMQDGRSSGTTQVAEGVEIEIEPIVLEVGHRLAGVVLGPSDAPLAGADVRIHNGRSRPRYDGRAESDADGRFQFGSLPPGPLQVEVHRPGFLAFRRSDIDATRGRELVVRLEAGLRVSGTVLDARSGRPVEQFAASIHRIGELEPRSNGTAVQQLRRRIDELRAAAGSAPEPELHARRLRIAAELESRLERVRDQAKSRPVPVPPDVGPVAERPGGRFAFEGLDEGLYAVGIASPDHQFARVEPVEMRRGMPDQDLHIELHAGHTVRGRVVSKHDATPIPGATVELVRVQEASRAVRESQRSLYPWVFARSGPQGVTAMVARTADDGSFEFRQAAPGRCLLSVRHARIADHETAAFLVQRGRQAIRVEVGERATLMGRVRGVAPGRVDDVEVIVLGGHGTMRTVEVRADGAYRFDGLQPGSYLVRAYPADEDDYVNRLFGGIFPLHAGAVDPDAIPRRDVTLAAGETRAFDLTLDLPPTGTVAGTVAINGQPSPDGRAILRPVPGQSPGSGGLSVRANFDDLGQFTLPDVPAGEYTLELYGATRQELYHEAITVAPDSTSSVRVDLAAGGLRGRVTAPDAASAAELRGYLWVLPGAAAAPTDLFEYRRTRRAHRVRVRDGVFVDDGLTPGPAVLIVDIRGRKPAAGVAVIPTGRSLELDLVAGGRSQ